ncbi:MULTISPECIES: hypothetical protein [unclassified Novosphingobium]|uniref:hypothetical protein n=1 Tax=unclassified Novosphingobium TaxID=2644732 RepID=UPI00146A5E3A|nr:MULTISPECIES: hypothetical protein [unclassified Novosphingobium]NMN02845.1 hypothetical protein [Novosphingobium sp. SG919]NMN87168.1 hypothetical protein [Novosphingobium sp. SG916]
MIEAVGVLPAIGFACTTGWIAARLAALSGTPTHDHLAALGRHWLLMAKAQALSEAALVAQGSDLVSAFPASTRRS